MPIKCIIVTPEKTVLNLEATFVVLPLSDGEYGILPHHAPLLARLGAGELRITDTNGQLLQYYVEGGFVEVFGDTIAMLTMYAMPAKELDLAAAEAELEKEQASPTDSIELARIRRTNLYNHKAKVRIAQKMAKQMEAQ